MSFDLFTTVMTIGYFVLIPVLCILYYKMPAWLFFPCLLGFVGFITFLFSIKSYEITGSEIIIHRYAGAKVIPRRSVKEARTLTRADRAGLLRTFGNGGLFGYYGRFSSFNLSMTWFCTRKDNLVGLFFKDGKTVVVSPDDVEGFCREVSPWRDII